MAQLIEQAGGIPLLFPLLEVSAIPDAGELNGQIARLEKFNLAIFISPNAVRYGFAAIRAAGEASKAHTDRHGGPRQCEGLA